MSCFWQDGHRSRLLCSFALARWSTSYISDGSYAQDLIQSLRLYVVNVAVVMHDAC